MSDDLRLAAERLRRFEAGEDPVEVYGTQEAPKMRLGKWGRFEQVEMAQAWAVGDRETLADAWMAEHHADDETPIDEAWLRSVGAIKLDHPQKLRFDRDALPIGLWNVDDGWKAMLELAPHHAVCIVRGLKTRSQFRLLARALGIARKP